MGLQLSSMRTQPHEHSEYLRGAFGAFAYYKQIRNRNQPPSRELVEDNKQINKKIYDLESKHADSSHTLFTHRLGNSARAVSSVPISPKARALSRRPEGDESIRSLTKVSGYTRSSRSSWTTRKPPSADAHLVSSVAKQQ